jgi:hypothetical protein
MPKSVAALMAGLLTLQGCRLYCTGPVATPQPVTAQPQPITADQTLFKTLVTAQAALESLNANDNAFLLRNRATVNGVILAYNASESAFALYARGGGNVSVVQADEAALTAELVQLTASLVQPMDHRTAASMHVTYNAAKPAVNLQTILSYLQTAAEIAQTIPVASPWASLAEVVISMVQKATAANRTATGVDMSQLHQLSLV